MVKFAAQKQFSKAIQNSCQLICKKTYCQTCMKQLSIMTIIHGQIHAQKQFSKPI